MNQTLAQRLLITLGRIITRSDVKLQERAVNMPEAGSHYPFKRSVWEKVLPEDMLSFYTAINGVIYCWSFTDKDDWHGPFMAALTDGKKTINLRSKLYALPFTKVSSFQPLEYSYGGAVDKKRSLLMFDGTDDAAGAVMLFDGATPVGVYSYHNDGYLSSVASDFTELMELGLKVGFCHMYRQHDHPIVKDVTQRLASSVPPRKTATLTVKAVEDCDNDAWRRALGEHIHAFYNPDVMFNDAMSIMKRKERYDKLDGEQRGALFAELFSDPNAVDDKRAQKMKMVSIYTPHKAKKDLSQQDYINTFRCHDEPLTRVEYTLEWTGEGPLKRRDDEDEARAFMSVQAFESLRHGCPFDADLFLFCPPSLRPQHWSPLIGKFNLSPPQDHLTHRVAYLRREDAAHIKPGSYDASALPSLCYRDE